MQIFTPVSPNPGLQYAPFSLTLCSVLPYTEFLETLDLTIQKAYESLRRTQARYKLDFDKRIWRINLRLKASD